MPASDDVPAEKKGTDPDLEVTRVTSEQLNIVLTLLKEECDAMRARSEPEHLYTAAALGGFGAVSWGVAALQPDKYFCRAIIWRPAMIAAIGILLVAVVVSIKIYREHKKYGETKKQQASLAKLLDTFDGMQGKVPKYMIEEKAGTGYRFSLAVVIVSALASIVFCVSLVWR